MKGLISTSKKLKQRRYITKPVKRVFVKKANGKMRSIGISSTQDKIVQKGIKFFLDQIFEPLFLDSSNGFRPQRSCHTALKEIHNLWAVPTWFIQVDLESCFDKINHKLLIEAINQRVRDKSLIMLLNQYLKAGYIHFENLSSSQLTKSEGSPQGCILSPLFCNILLHNFDVEIKLLQKKKNLIKRKEYPKTFTEEYRKAAITFEGTE